ncbi:MFS transporter [Paenarthrobacter aurescens]|uniref:MFS transporter n=1 Tax=Paenarthrobacter aurescens TaxID=43663 RepID=A0A4Y3NDX4_PAEAU|nr:MFS transporter [Paenarthrobacter aurescens]MDO6144952.1 MFS transporter [Paenarthrobacter aurescens]MDO6148797.1 MFS transporter [Paenarthrobacter aurescens]MDO6160043.1 MFS transporter [Paenarthrobacter aurescens]MDO6163902.1 MFS transporter [Paenarthrobacter aurescens]GEB17386.1 MFS transporter [Paenarthrobacter aurescens]
MTSDTSTAGILRRPYLLATVGACALVFLSAFESLAVTTIMPLVSRDLDGASLYALAFAGPLATGVMGMVAAGNWSDRRGPAAPLYSSVALFVLGLLIAGTAGTMEMLVLGRLVQGLGGGAMTVALYVLVARVYPPALHPKIFAAFAASWVVPSLVGPFAAGVVAQLSSWHWVFLGVVGLVVPALLMVVPAVRGMDSEPAAEPVPAEPVPWAFGRMGWAALAAVAVLGLNLSAEVPGFGGVIAVVALVIALIAVKPLVPRGTLTARRGLPSVILVRGLASAAFFGAEVYLPYLLTERYAFTPTFAGLTLTGAALAWAGASAIQGRLGARLADDLAVKIGAIMVLIAVISTLVTAALSLPAAVAIAGWILAGGGMGLMYPRLSVMTLALSTEENQGFNSAAMSISDSLGGALSLAATGLVFAAFTASPFAAVFALTAIIAVVGVVIAPRVAARAASPGAGMGAPDAQPELTHHS